MNKVFSLARRNWPIFLLMIAESLLFIANYKPGTYLIGWDNLFPEFNFGLNIKRSFFAVWQEYRGLGLLDGMSHSANLIHYLFLFLLSFFLPQSLLRYVFVFLTHILGGIGIYLLLTNYIFHNHEERFKKAVAFLGALFYQYNLATVQMYFLPFELFVTHFAALPWSIYMLQKFINQPKRKNLILLFLILFLSTPQAHVPSVFIVYAFALGIFLLFVLFQNGIKVLKTILIAFFLIFLANSFWGIPYFYSTINNIRAIAESKNNQIGTDDIFLRNQKFGDFMSVAFLRGISLDFVQYDYKQQVSGYMMQPWREFTFSPLGIIIGWVFFLITLFGLFYSVIKKQKFLYRFIFLWVITFLILGNDIPILGLFSYSLRTYIPYFYNVFRFVFTKFSILYVAMYSIFFAYGLSVLASIISKKTTRQLCIFLIALITLILGISSYSSFKGDFFYKNLRVEIPKEYFDTFKFFQGQDPTERIAILPAPWFWAWTQTRWGTIGSGFMWFGIQQPTLDRAFDPWSNTNENYYWELTQAIYSQDRNLFEKLLEKYQISWLLIDKNILQPSSPKALYADQLEEMIKISGKFNETISFGKIKIYKVNLETKPKDFVFLASNLSVVEPKYKWNNYDLPYLESGNYLSENSEQVINNESYYPFRSLFTGRKQEELEFVVEDKKDYFSFTAKIPKELLESRLIIPPLMKEEVTEINEVDFSKTSEKYPQVFLDGELINVDLSKPEENSINLSYIKSGKLEIRVPKINGYYSYDSEKSGDLFNKEPRSCDQFNQGIYKHDRISDDGKKLLRFTSIGSSNCLNFGLPNLLQRLGYLVAVDSRNILGKSFNFSVINKNSDHADLETNLPQNSELTTSYFIIPPMEQYGRGYSLYFDNQSYGRDKTINDLGEITVNPIPYNFLKNLKIVRGDQIIQNSKDTISTDFLVKHPNPSYYQITFNQLTEYNRNHFVLSQSFDPGWKVYEITNEWLTDSWYMKLLIPLFGKELKSHVLINNWENGWELNNETITQCNKGQCEIVIIYLPQYIEYFGFVIFLIFILYFLLTSKQKI